MGSRWWPVPAPHPVKDGDTRDGSVYQGQAVGRRKYSGSRAPCTNTATPSSPSKQGSPRRDHLTCHLDTRDCGYGGAAKHGSGSLGRLILPSRMNTRQRQAEESMIMNPSEGFAGAVWRKNTRSDSTGGQCVEVTLLMGWFRGAARFAQSQGRRARFEEPGWRGADLPPGRVEGLPVAGLDHGVSFVEVRGRPPYVEVGL